MLISQLATMAAAGDWHEFSAFEKMAFIVL